MHLGNVAAECNGHATQNLYKARIPNTCIPPHAILSLLHKILRYNSCFEGDLNNLRRSMKTQDNEVNVLHLYENYHTNNTEALLTTTKFFSTHRMENTVNKDNESKAFIVLAT
ncbi:hypothetical protein TNCT_227641 [Trichonephila clavata]|uniref:Uncharacterized protein n=1 Tax=Trichonephila clavata TaxID=2740835 RepID=A0A8X6HC46_TRICU|nr:hypothetical protein TNCT_227641 [Trichonephila clavata]